MIEAIKAILPKSSWPWVFSALRQNEVVWNALNDETFIRLAIGRIGRQPSAWTPARKPWTSTKNTSRSLQKALLISPRQDY
jgi:hypothetical protein